jgi:16S rRNA (guanine527-N7)-methyltransferase
MKCDIIQEMLSSQKIEIDKEKAEKINSFAEMIHDANRMFNLTGIKSKERIIDQLILKSIFPLRDIIVPRGTRFADIGSGAGIPGIALAIYLDNLSGVLIESNRKKADFIRSVINDLELDRIEIICERAEIIAHDKRHREVFSWCFSRAVGRPYIAIELGAPFLKEGGLLYIYSCESNEKLPENTNKHARGLGLDIMSHSDLVDAGLPYEGICFIKKGVTGNKYPRRFAVIKREARELEK